MKKILYVVLDGLGDLPIKELGDKTPLEAASTPYMDMLAKEGIQGLIYPVAKGIAPESDIAVISLLGYDAHKVYTGRGPLEAYATGFGIEDGDLALRVNFATIDVTSKKILDRRVGRSLTTDEATKLAQEINDKVALGEGNFVFKNTIGHRGILVFKKDNSLCGFITNTDPAYKREGVFGIALEEFTPYLQEAHPMPGYENDKGALLAAKLVNEFVKKSTEVLEGSQTNRNRKQRKELSANVILGRDAGDSLPKFKPIAESTGLRFGCFVQMPVEKGIALLCGMDVVDVPLPTEDLKRDYNLWASRAEENIKKFDALYIHIKGPDEPAHDGDFLKKKQIIEAIDAHFFGSLFEKVNKEDFIIAVTGDHSTPCSLKAHSADPVPIIVYGKEKDTTEAFAESQAKKGGLGYLLGREVIYKLAEFGR